MTGPRSRRRHPASHPNLAQNPNSAQKKTRELTTKRRGELAELAFTLKAASLGFSVSKPYGDSDRYDFILDARDDHYVCGGCPTLRDFRRVGSTEVGTAASAVRRRGPIAPRPSGSHKELSFRRASEARQEEPVVSQPRTNSLHRIQVKCSTQLLNGLYRVNAHRRIHGRAVPYLASEIDFLAAFIIPEDTWYIIPVEAIRGTSLLFRRRRDRRPGLYDAYREAWHLLRPK